MVKHIQKKKEEKIEKEETKEMRILGIIVRVGLTIGFLCVQRESMHSFTDWLLACLGVYAFLSYYAIMYSVCNEEEKEGTLAQERVSFIGFICGEIFTHLVLPLLFCLIPLLVVNKLITWIFPEKLEDIVRGIMMLAILVYPFVRDVRCIIGVIKLKQEDSCEVIPKEEIILAQRNEEKEIILGENDEN